eukprot:2904990-Rhodomonas_salina.4
MPVSTPQPKACVPADPTRARHERDDSTPHPPTLACRLRVLFHNPHLVSCYQLVARSDLCNQNRHHPDSEQELTNDARKTALMGCMSWLSAFHHALCQPGPSPTAGSGSMKEQRPKSPGGESESTWRQRFTSPCSKSSNCRRAHNRSDYTLQKQIKMWAGRGGDVSAEVQAKMKMATTTKLRDTCSTRSGPQSPTSPNPIGATSEFACWLLCDERGNDGKRMRGTRAREGRARTSWNMTPRLQESAARRVETTKTCIACVQSSSAVIAENARPASVMLHTQRRRCQSSACTDAQPHRTHRRHAYTATENARLSVWSEGGVGPVAVGQRHRLQKLFLVLSAVPLEVAGLEQRCERQQHARDKPGHPPSPRQIIGQCV